MSRPQLRPLAILCLALAGLALPARAQLAPQRIGEATARTPVLIELFTSEGCSSCPPADAALMQLVREQPLAGIELIALEEHVDYWNNLGWRDPFSAPVFSARQEAFLSAVGRDGMYTPQAVIDGKSDAVGSDRAGILAAARASAADSHGQASVKLVRGEARSLEVRADVSGLPGGGAELWIALVEDGLVSAVSRGENAGRTLPHASVVRALVRVAQAQGASLSGSATFALEPAWKLERLRPVAFAQDPATRHILAAAR